MTSQVEGQDHEPTQFEAVLFGVCAALLALLLLAVLVRQVFFH